MNGRKKDFTVAGLLRDIGGQQGVTLLELCIATIILAILVSIAVPVLLDCRKKADRVTAEYNLNIGGSSLNRMFFKMLDYDHRGDSIDSYRDYDPPEAMRSRSEFQSNGYVSVGAEYMSSYETKVKWTDLTVEGGSSPPVASTDISPALLATSSYGFKVMGIYVAGALKASGTEIAENWSLLPGKICVVENRYYWDGGWHENENNYYVTLITLEHSGVAHYLTMKQGAIVDYGCFDWKNGQGNPGEGWQSDQKPDIGTTPKDSSPAPADSSPAPDVTPPVDTTPADTPPADTAPAVVTPPADVTPPPVISIRIEPETLNLKSNGVFTVFIEMDFSPGYSVDDLDLTTITCFGAKVTRANIAADKKLILKIDRQDLKGVPVGDAVDFKVTGCFKDGTPFEGHDTIRVTD